MYKAKERTIDNCSTLISLLIGLYFFKRRLFIKKSSIQEYKNKKFDKKFRGFTFRYILEINDSKSSSLKEISSPVAYSYRAKRVFINNRFYTEESFLSLAKKELGDKIFNFIQEISKSKIDFKNSLFSEDLVSDFKNLEEPKDSRFYRFICGAGISLDYLGNKTWKDIQKRFSDEIHLNNCDELKALYNTDYGPFQLLKDINYEKYAENLIWTVTPAIEFTEKDETTLAAICKIIEYQNSKYNTSQTLLTFNLDNLLEVYLTSFNYNTITYLSLYKTNVYNHLNTSNLDLLIYHLHGYLPYRDLKNNDNYFDVYKKTIVFTDAEYKEAYSNRGTFSFSNLYSFLDKTSYFIGNSITDYEEQKVIKEHFKNYPSTFHFCFINGLNSSSLKWKIYKTTLMIKMGIIPLWYNDHNDYKNELLDYIKDKDI